MSPSRKPRRGERGSVMIESTFVLITLFAVIFAVIDISFAVFVENTMQFAVRQGVRYAITSQTMPGMGQDQSIKTVVSNYSAGLLNTLSPGPAHNGMAQVTIQYFTPNTLTPVTGTGSNVGGNIVVISCNGLSWAWIAPLLRSSAPLQFSVSSADIMEGTPIGGPPTR